MQPLNPAVTSRPSQVHNEICEIEKVAAAVSEAVEMLGQRLAPALRAEAKIAGTAPLEKEPVLVPVAGAIRAARHTLTNAHARLLEFLQGLEI